MVKGTPQLIAVSDCLCPGEQALFECTTFGVGATIWQGSAFSCTSGEIQLLHLANQFEGSTNVCNGGALVGRGLSVIDSCYTSQLNVTLSQALNRTTIQCVHDTGSSTYDVGSASVVITSRKC